VNRFSVHTQAFQVQRKYHLTNQYQAQVSNRISSPGIADKLVTSVNAMATK